MARPPLEVPQWFCAKCHVKVRLGDPACKRCHSTVFARRAMYDGDELPNIKKGELLLRELA